VSFKTIVVYIDSSDSAPALVSAAAKVAERFEAHLIGLYIVPPIPVYTSGELPAPVMITSHHTEQHAKIAEQAKHTFDEITNNRAFAAEWRVVGADSSVTTSIAEEAGAVDCLIIGTSSKETGLGLSENHVSKIVSAIPRPVMIIPLDHDVKTIGTDIAVGWDNSEEACRAVFDALPLLKSAQTVNLLHLNPTSEERRKSLGTSSELTNTLARHNINANLSFSSCGIGHIADELIRTSVETDWCRSTGDGCLWS